MFTTRLISGIVLVILAAFLLVKGGTLLFLVSLAISLIGLFELYRVMKIEKELPYAGILLKKTEDLTAVKNAKNRVKNGYRW